MRTFAGGMLGTSGCFLGAGTCAGSGAGLSYFSGCAGTSAGFSCFTCSDRQQNFQQLLKHNSASAPYPQSSAPFTIRNTLRHACGAALGVNCKALPMIPYHITTLPVRALCRC